ncbi:MAG: hypothetical protein AAFR38_07105 [Planctomycetota bacterium]
MPAARSRTERWRDGLRQICERGGGIEIAVDRGQGNARLEPGTEPLAGADLIWRVRLLRVADRFVETESAGALGRRIELEPGTRIVAAMTIGQNRWMFRSVVEHVQNDKIRLELPERVERCTRRAQHRISTAELHLPEVSVWPLRDPLSALTAEHACRARIKAAIESGTVEDGPELLPDVGAKLAAYLANIGGGGLGIIVPPEHVGAFADARMLWTRLDLRPAVPAPLELTTRIAHSHIDSSRSLHAGVAFEFAFGNGHRDFVLAQIERYMAFLRDSSARAA